ncbi:FkbM family methyltransferase [Sphingobium sp. CR28]|uniref:FkbM family methyltransferase n=1 Tax=Sphingobium sp. CR28 TaxID=3400272 RepID=UPI003FEF1508
MNWPRYRRELRDRLLATRLGLMGRQHQYGEIVALHRFINHFEIDCVVDVGANAGQYATMLRKDIGFTGTIVSFEPNPEIFSALAAKALPDPKWQVQNVALTDHDGTANFNIMAADQFSSLNRPSEGLEPIFAERNRVEKSVTVSCRRLDGVMNELEALRSARSVLLKLDTQGHDAAVCAGAGAVLANFTGVQTELAVRPLYAGSVDYRQMIAALEEFGFVPSAFFPNTKGHFPLMVEMDGLFVRRDLAGDGNIPLV